VQEIRDRIHKRVSDRPEFFGRQIAGCGSGIERISGRHANLDDWSRQEIIIARNNREISLLRSEGVGRYFDYGY
jgi:hypothetical protein